MSISGGVGRMARRKSEEKQVTVRVQLPPEAYFWVEFAAKQKGLSVGQHLRAWIIRSLEPWGADEPLPRDAPDIDEVPPFGGLFKRGDASPRREDSPDAASYLQAERAERNARALATRRKKRATQPKVIPDHIKAIAEARRQHPTLSLWQFSQLLFDQGIYASHAGDRSKAHPVNAATLSVWLRQAREAGLLPQKALPQQTPQVRTVAYPRKS
jgi:hypothetical protein